MREIKFRWYNAKHKKWLYWFYFENRWDWYITTWDLLDNPFSTPDDFKIERWSVSQYTGLKDKNGKEIDEEEITSESNREWFKDKWLVDNFEEEDFETFFINYSLYWFTEFRKFYDYCNINKEYIWCKQELTEKQWNILIWNMAFVHADLTK